MDLSDTEQAAVMLDRIITPGKNGDAAAPARLAWMQLFPPREIE